MHAAQTFTISFFMNQQTQTFYNTHIPSEWEVKELIEIAEGKISNGVFNDPRKVGKGYRLINVLDLYNEPNLDTSKLLRLDIESKEFERNKVKWGDIFFTRSSLKLEGIAHCNINLDASEDITYDGHIMKISPNQNIVYPPFLRFYCISSVARLFFMSRAKQSTMTTIGQDDIADMKIPLPPLPEQIRIAKVLGKMDDLIQKTQQLISQKELQKKWLMQQLLTGKKRVKGFEGEWKERKLGEMFVERNETKYNDLPLLSVGASGIYPQADSDKKDTSNEDKSKYKRICINDIGYNTMRMWQGRCALSKLEGIVSPAYTIVSPKSNADSLFFAYLFKTDRLMNLFFRNSQGLVDDTLNCKFKDFAIVKIHLPEKEEQSAIAAIFQAADKEVGLLKEKVLAYQAQKKGIMQQLLTGKTRLYLDLLD